MCCNRVQIWLVFFIFHSSQCHSGSNSQIKWLWIFLCLSSFYSHCFIHEQITTLSEILFQENTVVVKWRCHLEPHIAVFCLLDSLLWTDNITLCVCGIQWWPFSHCTFLGNLFCWLLDPVFVFVCLLGMCGVINHSCWLLEFFLLRWIVAADGCQGWLLARPVSCKPSADKCLSEYLLMWCMHT